MSETKMGRPSKRTPELIDEICLRIASGRSLLSISKDEDMPDHSTIWRWMHAEEDFRDKYARAIQSRAIHHAEEISLISQQVMRGEVPPDAARVALDAMKWTASKLLPKVYGDKQIVEANVTHTHQLHLDALRALSARRSGNDVGSIDAQPIDIPSIPTFSGERMDASDAEIVTYRVVEDAVTPPIGAEAGGAALASPTALHTGEKRSDPPTGRSPKRKARPKKNKS